jgi:hypothetical protein
VVESERSLKCENGRTKVSATLSALDQRVIIATVHGSRKLWRQPCRLL